MKFTRTPKYFVDELKSPPFVVEVIMRTSNGSTTFDTKSFQGNCHDSSEGLLEIYHYNAYSHI